MSLNGRKLVSQLRWDFWTAFRRVGPKGKSAICPLRLLRGTGGRSSWRWAGATERRSQNWFGCGPDVRTANMGCDRIRGPARGRIGQTARRGCSIRRHGTTGRIGSAILALYREEAVLVCVIPVGENARAGVFYLQDAPGHRKLVTADAVFKFHAGCGASSRPLRISQALSILDQGLIGHFRVVRQVVHYLGADAVHKTFRKKTAFGGDLKRPSCSEPSCPTGTDQTRTRVPRSPAGSL